MVEGLTCLHGCVQYGCCVDLGTLSWPWISVGRLRDTALVRCDLSVCIGGGVLADVCGASDVWCTAASSSRFPLSVPPNATCTRCTLSCIVWPCQRDGCSATELSSGAGTIVSAPKAPAATRGGSLPEAPSLVCKLKQRNVWALERRGRWVCGCKRRAYPEAVM